MRKALIALALVIGLVMVTSAQERSKRVWLYVLDATTNRSIAGASVLVSFHDFTVAGETDRHGRFLFDAPVGVHDVTITASAPGYSTETDSDTLAVTRNQVPQLAIYLYPSPMP